MSGNNEDQKKLTHRISRHILRATDINLPPLNVFMLIRRIYP